MNIINSHLHRQERAIFDLRELYEQFGYKKYKMSKFEEYDLYLDKKSFLPSQNIITFTDLSGKLMALKPDVTLSIAKNVPQIPNEPEKVYYNENVYRIPNGSREYKEIMQVGVEYLGDVDLYGQCEVLYLAYKSLQKLSDNCVMVISDLGFVYGLLQTCNLTRTISENILRSIGHKKVHDVKRICAEAGIDQKTTDDLVTLTTLSGRFDEVIPNLRSMIRNKQMENTLSNIEGIFEVLKKELDGANIKLDFSVINDLTYYNGLIFQGFIDGIPSAILTGGRYDNLMEKLSKNLKAIGFAVYIDLLEQYCRDDETYDFDVLLLYDKDVECSKLMGAVKMLMANGQRVRAQKVKSDKLKYKQVLKLTDRGFEILESID